MEDQVTFPIFTENSGVTITNLGDGYIRVSILNPINGWVESCDFKEDFKEIKYLYQKSFVIGETV